MQFQRLAFLLSSSFAVLDCLEVLQLQMRKLEHEDMNEEVEKQEDEMECEVEDLTKMKKKMKEQELQKKSFQGSAFEEEILEPLNKCYHRVNRQTHE